MNDHHKTKGQLISELSSLRDRIAALEGLGAGAEQREAEKALTESEERFRDVVENISEVFWMAKADLSEMIYVSPSYEAVWGRSCTSLYDNPKSWMDYIHPLDVEKIQAAVRQRKDTGHSLEYRIIQPDGTVRWIRDRGFPVHKRDGHSDRIAGIAEDITTQKHAEEALRASEERYRSLFNNCFEAVLLTSPDGAILAANPEACRLFGRTENELVSIGREGIVDVTDPRLAVALREREQTGKTRTELTFIRKDGTRFEGAVSSAVFRNRNGELRTSMVILDTTERKQAEARLRESEEQYRIATESSPEGVALIKGNDAFYANRRLARMFGHETPEEILEVGVKGVVHPADLQRLLEYGHRRQREDDSSAPETYEFRGIKKDGTTIFVEASVVGINYHGERVSLAYFTDITERKEAEEALREYERVVEGSQDMIAVVDRSYRYRLVNETYRNYRDTRKEDLIGRSCAEVLGSDVFENTVKGNLDRCFLGETIQYELNHVYPELGERYLLVSYFPISHSTGIDRIAVIIRDITQNKEYEEALRKSESRYRRLFENMRDGFASVDMDKRIVEVNAALRSMLGYPLEELCALTYEDVTSQKWHAFEENIIQEQVLKRGYSDPFEKECIRKDGTILDVEVRVHLLRDDKGVPSGMWAFVRDVSERKRVQTALRESEERFRRYFELGLIGMAITSPIKGILEVNDEVCKILGYERSELLQMTWEQLTHVDDLAADVASFNRVLAGQIDGYSVDKRFIGKDGRVICATISVKCLRGPDGSVEYFVALLQDITQRKKAEDALKKREQELENKSLNLEEANTALKVLLRHRDEDKKALEDAILTNVKELIFPYTEKLRKTLLTDNQATYVSIIESNLNEIVSPFVQKMAAIYSRFTPSEIQIANLIRSGKTSKEIAELLHLSIATIETHRNNIRKKLDLRNKKLNLQAYLLSL